MKRRSKYILALFQWMLLLFLAAVPLEGRAEVLRDSASLNGPWHVFVYWDLLPPPPEDLSTGGLFRLPACVNSNGFTNGAGPDFEMFPSLVWWYGTSMATWMQREIEIPEQWSSGRIFLCFDAVTFHTIVYLDGEYLGENWDGHLPFEYDITDRVLPGRQHTLTVGAESAKLHRLYKGLLDAPHGSFWGLHHVGIWQDVRLEQRPSLRIEDVWVRTSVSDATAAVRITVQNDTEADAGTQASFTIHEASGGKRVKGPHLAAIEVPRGSTAEQEWVLSWPEARYWSPEDPFLYRVEVELAAAADQIDHASERFGFREFRIEGSRFLLNGIPRRLRGDAWHWMGIPYQSPAYARCWYEQMRSMGLDTVRLHAQVYPEFYLDLADEVGILVIDETSLWGSGKDTSYTPVLWQRMREHLSRLVRRDRNHPSVVLWSLANEVLAGHYSLLVNEGIDDGLTEAMYLREMTALKKRVSVLDGTRPVLADGDSDGFGLFPIISYHYVGPQSGDSLQAWRSANRVVSVGECGAMHYTTPPGVASWVGPSAFGSYEGFLEGLARDLSRLLENYRLWVAHICPFNLVWYGLEPLVFSGEPIAYADPSESGPQPARLGPYVSTLNPGYDAALPVSIVNPVGEAIRRELRPVRMVVMEKDTVFFGGSTVSREVYVINDVPREAEYRLQWLEAEGGMTRTRLDQQVHLGPASDERLLLEWTCAEVDTVVSATWSVSLFEGEAEVDQMEIPIEIHPRALARPQLDDPAIGYYHPTRSPGWACLGEPGWTELIQDKFLIPQDVQTLIIGAEAELEPKECARLMNFLIEGGRAVVLERNASVMDFLGVALEEASGTESWAAYAVGEHPITAGLGPTTLRDWQGDRSVFGERLPHFSSGNGRVVISDGPGKAVLVDLPVGQGRLLWSGLLCAAKLDSDPRALALFAEMLTYAHTAPAPGAKKAFFVGPQGSALEACLSRLGVGLRDARDCSELGQLPSESVVILDAQEADWLSTLSEATRGMLVAFVREGGVVLAWGSHPESVSMLAWLLPEEPILEEADHPHLMASASAPETAGVPAGLLYWLDGAETGRSIIQHGILRTPSSAGRRDLLTAPLLDWRMLVRQPETTRTSAILRSQRETPPPALSAYSCYPLGQGRVYLCQLRAEVGLPRNEALICALLSALNIWIHPFGANLDISTDGKIDCSDLFLLAQSWQQGYEDGPQLPRLDFDLDGKVGDTDILMLLNRWHWRCEVPQAQKAARAVLPSLRPGYTLDPRLTPEYYLSHCLQR